jgi:hypothetical protein
MAYKYCTATNWGKNFFTHEERKNFYLRGQAIVDAQIEASQTTWDALSAEEQEFNPRPVKYNLP